MNWARNRITYDAETGQRYTYLGAGMSLDNLKPDSVLAYSPIVQDHCEVLFVDGSVEQITAEEFRGTVPARSGAGGHTPGNRRGTATAGDCPRPVRQPAVARCNSGATVIH